jgi:hypothetical protein
MSQKLIQEMKQLVSWLRLKFDNHLKLLELGLRVIMMAKS